VHADRENFAECWAKCDREFIFVANARLISLLAGGDTADQKELVNPLLLAARLVELVLGKLTIIKVRDNLSLHAGLKIPVLLFCLFLFKFKKPIQ